MPLLRDKVINNAGTDEGNSAMIGGGNRSVRIRLQVLRELCDELEAFGLLIDTVVLRDRMEVACNIYNDAQRQLMQTQRAYIAAIDEITREVRVMIDKHILSKP